MIRYEKTINDLIITFRADALRYTHICERLVQPLMPSLDDLSNIIDNPRNGAWKDEDLGNRLQASLDKDYVTFIDTVGRLNQRLMKFATNLDLDVANDLKPKWLSQPSTGHSRLRDRFISRSNKTLKGLKAGFQNGSLEKALHQVEYDLHQLECLLDGRDRLMPMRKQRVKSGQVKVWNNIRAAARSIYDGLAAHWQCPSTHRHTVSLRLETREVSDNCDIRFGAILDLQQGGTNPQQVIWHDVEIEPKTTSASTQPHSQPVTLGPFRISSMSATPRVQITPAPAHVPQPTSGTHITDLCHWQQSFRSANQDQFGFLKYDVWQYHLYRGKLSYQVPTPPSHLSLCDCLAGVSTTQTHASLLAAGLGPKEK